MQNVECITTDALSVARVSSIRGSRLTLAAHASPEKSTLTTRHCILMRTLCPTHQPTPSSPLVSTCQSMCQCTSGSGNFLLNSTLNFSTGSLPRSFFFFFFFLRLFNYFLSSTVRGVNFFGENFNKFFASSVFVLASTV